ncbi:MAG: small multi-drug export protein, partial [Eubacterium sp.]
WGLMIFVAIPLPGTGVWTGCLAASLIEMDFKKGMMSVMLGSAIAGIIVTLLCAFGLMAVGG